MRHRNTVKKLNRAKTERVGLIKNLLKSIVKYEVINTTEARYKVIRGHFDKLVNTGKVGDQNSTRRLFAILRDEELVKKVTENISTRYANRKSGYLKSYKLENRGGDNAKMVRLEVIK